MSVERRVIADMPYMGSTERHVIAEYGMSFSYSLRLCLDDSKERAHVQVVHIAKKRIILFKAMQHAPIMSHRCHGAIKRNALEYSRRTPHSSPSTYLGKLIYLSQQVRHTRNFRYKHGRTLLDLTESGVERQKLPWCKHRGVTLLSSAENLLIVHVQRHGIVGLQTPADFFQTHSVGE